MSTPRFLFGLFSAVTLDVGVALMAAHVLLRVTGREFHSLALLLYYGGAIAVTLAPDFIDLLFKGRQMSGKHHSSPTHWPFVALFTATVIGAVEPFWGVYVGSILLLHYIHDSLQRGTGIEWLAPFVMTRYTFIDRPDHCPLCDRRHRPGMVCLSMSYFSGRADERFKLVYALTRREILCRDLTLTEWLEAYYLCWSGESVAGLIVAAAAALTLSLW